MGKTYYALDNEFAAATGSNVYVTPDKSDFDYPPSSTKDLVLVGSDADATPYVFSVGETYDISWTGGAGGGGTIQGAEIVRSDVLGADSGVVVFEGLDGNGDLAQIVWTPNMDLESWYFNNFSGGTPPQFYVTDQQSSQTYQYVCFAAGTRIAVPGGTAPVEALGPGARVCAADGGTESVIWTGRRRVPGQGAAAPVLFAPGALGNDAPLMLSQQHRVLLASPLAEMHFGASQVFVPARALVDHRQVRLAPCASVDYVHLLLPRHDILTAAGGAPCESLFAGDVADAILGPQLAEAARRLAAPDQTARLSLTMAEAQFLAGAMAGRRVAA